MKRRLALVEQELESSLPVPAPRDALEVLALVVEKGSAGIRGYVATVIERLGSAPGTPGQKLMLAGDGTCAGTVGGGAIEKEVLCDMRTLLRSRSLDHCTREFSLGAELGMCCGGRMRVQFEPIASRTPCLLLGGGHVATATAPLLANLGFAVTVIDARDSWGEARGDTSVCRRVGEYEEIANEMFRAGLVAEDAVLLAMTHDHALDQEVIEWALKRKFAFVGGVGSRAKAKRTSDRLEARGFTLEDIARVRMPVGVSIGARLPGEIAVSIAGELIGWRKQQRDVRSGSLTQKEKQAR